MTHLRRKPLRIKLTFMTDALEKYVSLQVQPGLDSFREWEAVADEEDLRYEVLELSAPPALNESGRFQRCAELCRSIRRIASLH